MIITFISQYEAESLPGKRNVGVISITDPSRDPADINPGFGGVLRLGFHDIEAREEDERFKAISHDQANQIVSFFRHARAYGLTEITVHCWAGVSRSAAVAIIGCLIHGVPVPPCAEGANKTVLRRCWLAWLRQSPFKACRYWKVGVAGGVAKA